MSTEQSTSSYTRGRSNAATRDDDGGGGGAAAKADDANVDEDEAPDETEYLESERDLHSIDCFADIREAMRPAGIGHRLTLDVLRDYMAFIHSEMIEMKLT